MKRTGKIISILVTISMILSLMPAITLSAFAADNEDYSVFDALGIDDSVAPDGFNSNNNDNPYGASTVNIMPVSELFTVDGDGKKLYGHNKTFLKDHQDYYTGEAITSADLTGGMSHFNAVSGDFAGSGLKSEIAVAGAGFEDTYDDSEPPNLTDRKIDTYRLFFDSTDNETDPSNTKELKEEGAENFGLNGEDLKSDKTLIYNYLKLAAGDFTGDGIDEIAVFVPEQGNSRVVIYTLQIPSGQSAQSSWSNADNWEPLYSYAINSNGLVPNKVTLMAEDFTGDGVDDLGIAWGVVSDSKKVKSRIQILNGSRSDSDRFNTIDVDTDDLYKASFDTGDIDGDKQQELVIAGYPAGYSDNYIQLAYYEYDDENNQFIRRQRNNINAFTNEEGKFNTLLTAVNKDGIGKKDYIYAEGFLFELNNGSFIKNYGSRPNTVYEVSSTDLTGNGKEELVLKRTYYSSSLKEYKYQTKIYKVFSNQFNEYKNYENIKYSTSCNTDEDTVQMRFIGKRVVYSDPKVLAVLASPPYFKDLEHLDGGSSYVGNSSTTYGTSEGSSSTSTTSSTISVGSYTSFEQEFSFWGISLGSVEAETELSKSWTIEAQQTSSRTQTIEYTTMGGQDTVALYSIPLVIYEYETKYPVVNGNTMSWETQKSTITEPHEASVRTYTLEAYDEIAKYYDILPTVGGNILKHDLGNPATYPTSTAGYRYVNQPDGPSIGVGYGSGGAITQTLELTQETSVGTSTSTSISTKAGAGAGGVTVGVTAGSESGSGKVNTNLNGKSFSTTIVGMPEEASEYGYDYNVKMFQHTKSYWGQSIPVVNYVVSQLSMPPVLPDDFGMDREGTTSDQIKLTWTDDANGDSVIGYQVFKQYDFPDGSADFPVEFVEANSKDINGVFSYVDNNLNPNTEYSYKIQVLSSQSPDRSVKSDILTVKTRPDVGNPEISLNGVVNSVATVYPDVEKTITATVTNSETNVGTPVYQWQRYVSGQWRDLSGKTSNTLTFTDSNLSINGEYRLRVNQFVNENAVSVYSNAFKVEFSKRDVECDNGITVAPGFDDKVSISIALSSSDSNSEPSGDVIFDISGEGYSKTMVQSLNDQTAIVEDLELPDDGLYNINAYYGGNNVFNSLSVTHKYLKGDESSYWIEILDKEYGEGVSPVITEYKIEDNIQTSKDITNDPDYSIEYTYTNKADNTNTSEAVNVGEYTVSADVYEHGTLTKDFSITQKQITITAPNIEKTRSQAVTPDLDALTATPSLVNSDNINDLGLEIICLDNSGREVDTFDPESVDDPLPGRYTIRVVSKDNITDEERKKQSNYEITFVDGKYTVIGATHRVTMNADKSLEDKSIGSIELISPEEADSLEFQQNTSLTFKATPDAGYEVDKWYLKASSDMNYHQVIPTEDNNIYTCTMPGEDIAIRVSFKVKETNINFSAPNGEIDCIEIPNLKSGDIVTKNGTYTFTAIADVGYHFVRWEKIENNTTSYPEGITNDDGNPQIAITIGDYDVTIVPIFERDNYQLSLSENLKAYYLDGSDNKVYIEDSTVAGDTEVTVEPEAGYTVSQNEEGAYLWNSNVQGNIGLDGQVYTFTVTENALVEATLERTGLRGKIDISEGSFGANEVTLKIDDVETSYTLGEDFSFESGADITIETNLDYGAELAEYNCNGTISIDEIFNLTNVTENLDITITIEELDKYELDFSDVDNRLHGNLIIDVVGQDVEIDPITNKLSVYKGDTVSITAKPDTGYMVGYWNINGVRTSTNEKIRSIETINDNHEVTCEFIPLVYYDLNFGAGDNGSINAKKDDNYSINTGEKIGGGSKVEFTAAPDNGYMIEKWEVNGIEQQNEFGETYVYKTFTIDGLCDDSDVTVYFKEENIHTITVDEPEGATILGEFIPDNYPEETYKVRDGAAYVITTVPDSDYRIETVSAVVYKETVTEAVYFNSVIKDINDPWICTINNVEGDITVSADTLKLYDLEKGIYEGGTINIIPSNAPDTHRAVAGEDVSISATVLDGYRFINWIVEDDKGNTVDLDNKNELNTIFIMPEGNVIVSANIKKLYDINASVFEGGSADSTHSTAVEGETVEVTATVLEGYRFVEWEIYDIEGNLVDIDNENDEHTSFIMPEGNITISAVTEKLYNVKVKDRKGCSLTINPLKAAEGELITITATISKGYRFKYWTVRDVKNNIIFVDSKYAESTKFIMPKDDVTVIPVCESTDDDTGGGAGGGISISPPIEDNSIDKALKEGTKNSEGKTVAKVQVSNPDNEGAYGQDIPKDFFKGGDKIVEIETPVGKVSLPDDIFNESPNENVKITIKQENKQNLHFPEDIMEQIGDKPVIDINLEIGGKKTKWESKDKRLKVSIPYELKEEEKLQPHKVIAIYIDDDGNITPLTVSNYNFSTGTVEFNTNHTSYYSIQYGDKTFEDIGDYAWAQESIEALAVRGVINGISETEFAPQNNITRADFVTLVARFFGFDKKGTVNFKDVDTGTYYYDAVATAKSLGIVSGTGNNMFSPQEFITRQDMMVIIKRSLETASLSEKMEHETENSLDNFLDKEDLADYAVNSVDYLVNKGIVSGDGMYINPNYKTKRAEVAALLYKILKHIN